MHALILAAQTQQQTPPSVTVSVWWILATAFFGGMGLSAWKLLPWVIKQALDEKIDSKLLPMVTAVHDRIDSHMDTEESSFDTLNSTVSEVSNQLVARDELFNGLQVTMDKTRNVLETHMANDEAQFAMGAEALLAGQRALIERLEKIEENTNQKAASIQANTDRNARVIEDAVATIVDASDAATIARDDARIAAAEISGAH